MAVSDRGISVLRWQLTAQYKYFYSDFAMDFSAYDLANGAVFAIKHCVI